MSVFNGYINIILMILYLSPTASVIIQQGTLKIGDYLYGNSSWARVRAMRNDTGRVVKMATPAMPVFTMGWKELPDPGEVVVQEKKSDYSSVVLEDVNTLQKEYQQQKQQNSSDSLITVPVIVKGVTSLLHSSWHLLCCQAI